MTKQKSKELNRGKTGQSRGLPPDGGWGWIVVMGVSLVNFSTRSIEPSFGLLFGDTLEKLSIATAGAGVIVSTYEAIVNFSGLFVGPLIKSYSYRKVAMVGGVLAGFGLVSTYDASSMTHILCTYSIINGLGIGFSSSATFVSLNHYFKKRRGQAVGITMTGTGLGLLLMPQAVRYLTEEYGFAGSILIIGAIALNACVGACLLQPIKWHLRKPTPEQGSLLADKEKEMNGNCPQIKITTTTISEKDEEDEEQENVETFSQPEEQKKEDEKVDRILNNQRKWSMISRQHSLFDNEKTRTVQAEVIKNALNKSSTETKLDNYFEEGWAKPTSGVSLRKLSDISYNVYNQRSNPVNGTSNNSINKEGEITANMSVRKRKSSTISNLSNLDFHGKGLHIHAIKHEVESETEIKESALGSTSEHKPSLLSRFVTFMDLDLLKDPIFLNILFGLSIFYVAELNFKMVVPFFLADLGHSKSETAFCLSMMAASDIVARVVLPPICDRITFISRRTMFMTGCIFCAASRSALAETGDWIKLETILIISGFFRGATLINFMLVISEYCDDQMEKLPAAFGLHMVAKGIFIAAFGPVIGLIRDATGSFPLCIHAQSVCILLCTLAWTLEYVITYLRKPRNKTIT